MGYCKSYVLTSPKVGLKGHSRPRRPAAFSNLHSTSHPAYPTTSLRSELRACHRTDPHLIFLYPPLIQEGPKPSVFSRKYRRENMDLSQW